MKRSLIGLSGKSIENASNGESEEGCRLLSLGNTEAETQNKWLTVASGNVG